MFAATPPARTLHTRAPFQVCLVIASTLLLTLPGCTGSQGNLLGDGSRPTLGASAVGDDSTDGLLGPAGVENSGGDVELRIAVAPVFCCNPLSLEFSAELIGDFPPGSATYEWVFGDGRTDNGVAITHTYPWPGTYEVSLTALMGNGESITTSQTLTLGVADDGGSVVTLTPDARDGSSDETTDDGTGDDIVMAGTDDGPGGGDPDPPDGDPTGTSDDPITGGGGPVGGGGGGGGGGGTPPIPVISIVRAMYSHAETELLDPGALVDDAVADGFTDFVAKFGMLQSPLGVYDVVGLNAWIQKLDESGSDFWPAINWASTSELSWIAPFEPFVTREGNVLSQTPCPTSEHYWTKSIAERGAALAAIALDHPTLKGMVVDVEMYQSELRKYTEPSYSDTAFQAYLNWVAPGTSLPPTSQRYAWVLSHGGEQAYIDFQRETVRRLAADALATIRAVNPMFEVGGTGMVKDGEWFYDAFALGFGTAQKPLYEFTQRYYRAGYSDGVQAFVAAYQARGIHAKLVVGLQLDYYPPDALADHFYTGAIETAGAWISDGTEYADGAQDDNCYTLQEYRSALSYANSELDAYIANPDHVSPLVAEPFVPACTDDDPVLPPTVYVPLEDGPVAGEEMRLRQQTNFYFYAVQGEAISFDLVLHRVGSDYLSGWWVLKGPDDAPIDSGAWTPETSPAMVRATANETGLYALVIDPSWRFPFSIVNASHPGSYTGAPDGQRVRLFAAHLLGQPQLYAYVPPGVTDIGVSLWGQPGENTHVVIYDERDPGVALLAVTPQAEIDTNFSLLIPNDVGGQGAVLGIALEDAGNAEDFQIGISSGALPFLSQTRSGLLHEP